MKMTQHTKRWLLGVIAVLCCLWLGFLGYVDWTMHQTPELFGHAMAGCRPPAYFLFPFETMWIHGREGSLSVEDTAPDLEVKTLDAKAPLQFASLWADNRSCWCSDRMA